MREKGRQRMLKHTLGGTQSKSQFGYRIWRWGLEARFVRL